jgi:hypothetical protein
MDAGSYLAGNSRLMVDTNQRFEVVDGPNQDKTGAHRHILYGHLGNENRLGCTTYFRVSAENALVTPATHN